MPQTYTVPGFRLGSDLPTPIRTTGTAAQALAWWVRVRVKGGPVATNEPL